jgi:uncharacterized protein involved in response to NO
LAIAGGFALALLLPLAEALRWDWGARLPALVQAHGHLQVLGWVGCFVIGMALRLVPRFAGRPLSFAPLTPVILALILAALLGRAVAQPWLDKPGMHGLLGAAALAELAGALLFAATIVPTLAPAIRTLPVAPLFLLGALGMVAEAALGALWLSALTPELPIVTPDRDSALLGIQFYAFLLPFVLGVSLRSLPTFFKHRAPRAGELWLIAGLLAVGSLLFASPALWGRQPSPRVQQTGALLIALAMLGAFLETGVWKSPLGLRPSARHSILLIRTAYLWMLLAAIWLALGAASFLISGQPSSLYSADAIRHMLALGLFSTLIAGMAHLMLPWLAQRRLPPARAERETLILWALFSLAAILRVAGALLDHAGVQPASAWLVALSGVVGISAVLFLATTLLSAMWRRPETIPLAITR